jgi:hypothetical protein
VAARERTPAEHEERVEKCAALDQQVKTSIRKGREAAWELAEALHHFDEESGWTALDRSKALDDWLAEVELSKAAYYRFLRVYRETVVRRRVGLPSMQLIDPSKVDIVLPAVKEGW